MLQNKTVAGIISLIAVVGLLAIGFAFGFREGVRFPQNLIVHGVIGIDPTRPVAADFSTFWQAWNILDDGYLRNNTVKSEKKVDGAIAGLVSSLGDPYTAYFPPEENKKFQQDIQGNFGGVGAEIGVQKGQLVVIAPLKNTPASRAGLKAGDAIFKINASSTDGLTVDEAVSLIRGPEGSVVSLTLFRDGWKEPKEFKIKREQISAPTIDFEMRGTIAYIQLHSFNANTDQLFYNAAMKALNNGAKGMVLDLRDDPGGYLNVAVDMAGWFMPKGTLVVSEEARNKQREDLKSVGNAALEKIPLVVLINKGSASAAEILAGALRDNNHTQLIGEQSFGKGTVQELEELRNGGSIKMTIAHWVLPSGAILENGGLKPNIEVKLTDDDIKNQKDPQLDKALEVVKTLVK